MNSLFDSFVISSSLVFWAMGGLLLIFELLGTGGYALWSGLAAILVGVIAWLFPQLPWSMLWLLWAIATLIIAYLWWLWLNSQSRQQQNQFELNQPQSELIGIKTVIVEPIVAGRGRVKINDGSWSANCDQDLPAGTLVEVIAVKGLVLQVQKLA